LKTLDICSFFPWACVGRGMSLAIGQTNLFIEAINKLQKKEMQYFISVQQTTLNQEIGQ